MNLHELAARIGASPELVLAQARGIVRRHTEAAAAELRSVAPSRRVAASVVTEFVGNRTMSRGTARPTSPLAHLLEGGTGPRYQRTTGRYTGIMPAQPYAEKVRERAAREFIADLSRIRPL